MSWAAVPVIDVAPREQAVGRCLDEVPVRGVACMDTVACNDCISATKRHQPYRLGGDQLGLGNCMGPAHVRPNTPLYLFASAIAA